VTGVMTTSTTTNATNPTLSREALLRLVLKLDAVVTAANGVAYLAAAGPLEDLLGVDASVQRPIGAFLMLFAAGVWLVATRPAISRGAVLAIAGANALWVIASLTFAGAGISSPTTAGTVWIVLQALVVGGFATLQAATAGGAGAARQGGQG
jgi:hypothetical protein